jgi:hypothetical protein
MVTAAESGVVRYELVRWDALSCSKPGYPGWGDHTITIRKKPSFLRLYKPALSSPRNLDNSLGCSASCKHRVIDAPRRWCRDVHLPQDPRNASLVLHEYGTKHVERVSRLKCTAASSCCFRRCCVYE